MKHHGSVTRLMSKENARHNSFYKAGKLSTIIATIVGVLTFLGLDVDLHPSKLFGVATKADVQTVNTRIDSTASSLRFQHQQDINDLDEGQRNLERVMRCVMMMMQQPVEERNESECEGDPLER